MQISSSDEESVDEVYSDFPQALRYRDPLDPNILNTSKLDGNDFLQITKHACGILNERDKMNNCIASMIQKRCLGPGFSIAQKCRISNKFLPHQMHLVAVYTDKVFCGTFSNDAKFFLTTCQDKYLRLYQTHNHDFAEYKSILARDVGWNIVDTAFSPDGKDLVYSTWSDSLYLCPVYGNSILQERLPLNPEARRFCIFSVTFSHDGREILGSGSDGYLYIYDREFHQRIARTEIHDQDANAIAFADNTSQILYSAGDDGLCKVWDRRMLNDSIPRPVGILAGHMDGITYIDSRGDGRYLITNSKDQTIKLWDIRAFSSSNGEENTRKAVANQNWNYTWQRVPKQLQRSRSMLKGDTSVMTYRGHTVLRTLVRCRFSPAATTGQRYIYSGCASGRVVIYDVLTGETVKLFGHKGCVRDVSWHPTNQEILSCSWDGNVLSWRCVYCKFLTSSVRRRQRIAAQKAQHAAAS